MEEEILKSGYINEPTTVEEFKQNVKFQFDNIHYYLRIEDYESALIKAEYFVDALKGIIQIAKE